jgi:acetyltransferase-like isoleucine patch superfamily enzyme
VRDVEHENIRRPIADPLDFLPRAFVKIYSAWVKLTYPFASIGSGASFHFTSKLSRQRATRIRLGNSVSVGEHAWLNVATHDPAGQPTIVIDDNCVIAFGSIISAKNQVHLERDVNVAQQVLIMDHNHAYEDIDVPIIKQGITMGGTVRIGEGSWIGHGAAIVCSRGELRIGRHCVVAANSVVMRSIPDYSVVFGIPAAIIRQYDPETRIWKMGPLNRGTHLESRVSVEVNPALERAKGNSASDTGASG